VKSEETRLVKLKFYTPLHLGEPGIGVEGTATYAPSDTLFSGLCHAWRLAYGEKSLEKLLEQFREHEPPFRISSAFPYFQDDKDKSTLFFPIPLFRRHRPLLDKSDPRIKEHEVENMETLKTALDVNGFVDDEIFHRWVAGRAFSQKHYNRIANSNQTYDKIFEKQLLPKTCIDRIDASSGLYFLGQVHFKKGGLFCLVRYQDEQWYAKLKVAFETLGEQGLGGERSMGYGQFKPEFEEWEEPWLRQRGPKAYCTLSLYHPSDDELAKLKDLHGYELVKRGGWVDSPYAPRKATRRKPCRMFKEGSILCFKEKGKLIEPMGKLVDVTPQKYAENYHSVYRYGFAFNVPVGDLPRVEEEGG
jgi:CRISPR-associated protein Csm4